MTDFWLPQGLISLTGFMLGYNPELFSRFFKMAQEGTKAPNGKVES
jgi:hypothetical protein